MDLPDPEVVGAIFNGLDAATGTAKSAWNFSAAKEIVACLGGISMGIWLIVKTYLREVPEDPALNSRFIGPALVIGMSIILWIVIRARIRMDRESKS